MSICRDTSSNKIPCSSSNAVNQFSLADWDPILSMNQNPNFNGSAGFSSHNAGVPESQWMAGPNATAIEKFLNLSCIGSDNNSEIMGSFGSCEINQIASAFCPSESVLPEECGIVKNLKKKKRKRMPECSDVSPHSSVIGVQNEQEEDGSPEALGSPMIADEKNKNVEAIEEDYVHVRAKSGQATNSHSLAERVRRERINERMKLLQGLVPGCNKITGKASMLDEIINYVQSLQKQVEFLSMKLVAVDSGLTLSTRQVALKDNQISEYGGSAIQRYNPISLYGSSQQQVIQAELAISGSHNLGDMQRSRITSHISSMAQLSSTLRHELQGNIQMDFISNLNLSNM